MKEKGFTLIELLAVIVILAVIALIATPLIMNVIDSTKEEVTKRSVQNIQKGAETFLMSKKTLDSNYTFNMNDYQFKGNQFGKGTDDERINIVFNDKDEASVAVYENNKCYYILAGSNEVKSETGLEKQQCLEKAGATEIVEGNPLLPQIEANLCTTDKITECYKTEGNEYIYTGASGTGGVNWLWYGGHLWRIIKVDKTTGRYTLITSYPVTAINWGSSSCITAQTCNSLEESYVGDWLNNVFIASLPTNVRSKLENMTYTREVYNVIIDFTLSEEISNVKVRLLTQSEYRTYGGYNSYLDIKDYYWLADIYSSSFIESVDNDGRTSYNNVVPSSTSGVRPVVEVFDITIIEGDGTLTAPYIVNTSKTTNVSDIAVGEYISIPKSDGGTYLARVVKHDQSGTKVILNSLYSRSAFGDNSTFSTSSTIYTGALTNFKNSLDSNYFDSTNHEFNMTWYSGGTNYANATTMFTGNIGLPSVGEMFSGNDIDMTNGSTAKTFVDTSKTLISTTDSRYWLINSFSNSVVRSVNLDGRLTDNSMVDTDLIFPFGVRPTWYVKDSAITGGSGTANDPYTLK